MGESNTQVHEKVEVKRELVTELNMDKSNSWPRYDLTTILEGRTEDRSAKCARN